jgi:UDP-glucose 4-epimerase
LIDFRADIVFHLGEYSRVEQSFEDIAIVWESNRRGTLAVLEFVRKTQSKIVYAGSSTKYGDEGLGRNASPYAWSKSSNTELVCNYGQWFDVPYAITYFYNVYGGREISDGKYATLIAIFRGKFLNGEKLTVVLPGTQRRNFTHISDIVSGLVLVGKNGFGDEFGIGSQEEYSILEVAKMFGGTIKMLPERAGNRMTASLMTRNTELLGWKETKSLAHYIESIISDVDQ